MSKKERINFDDLKRDVIDKGICALCRGCVSFCSADYLNALTMKEEKPAYFDEDACLKCGICYMICPRTEDLEEALKKIVQKDPKRAKDVLSFYLGLEKCIKQAHKILKPQKYFCVVIGNTLVKQTRIRTDFIIAELSENIGFICEDIIIRKRDNDQLITAELLFPILKADIVRAFLVEQGIDTIVNFYFGDAKKCRRGKDKGKKNQQ